MNEDLIEKIAIFIERQCPRKMVPGAKCSEYSCTVHWMSAQIRNRKFEGPIETPEEELNRRYPRLSVDVMR